MTAVTICCGFGAQEKKLGHCFHVSPFICHEVTGPDAVILVFQDHADDTTLMQMTSP